MRSLMTMSLLAGLLSFSSASAATINFLNNGVGVDGGLPGTASGSSLGTSSISLLGGQLELRATSFLGFPGSLTQSAQGGVGIAGGTESDEIDRLFVLGSERLSLNVLSGDWLISEVQLRSLYRESTCRSCPAYNEVARVRVYDGASFVDFDLFGNANPNSVGALTYGFAPMAFTSVDFFVPSGFAQSLLSEFSLGRVEVTQATSPVPEPATMMFTAGGLLATAVARLRKRRQ